ncbi:glycerol defect protein 1 suppressor [Tothia fuscella]|uniref:Glycerol defect protein 1 suppressor n=1 Tax=Tothia fuscella TaxID=1048955 RepID=A0A9P4TW92_9PEZI|nr:glycerol defect protein 1 suppressor [Tothia fuscella]
MSHANHVQPKLPKELLDRLETSGGGSSKPNGRKGVIPRGRKEQRKSLREQKKVQRTQTRKFPVSTRPAPQKQIPSRRTEEYQSNLRPLPEKSKQKTIPETEPALKSILKKKPQDLQIPPKRKRSPPEPEPEKRVPRAIRDKLAEDDAKIAALEKKLGVKGRKKLPKMFEEDGLDEILGSIDDLVDEPSSKRKRDEYDAWLEKKRRKSGKDPEPRSSEDEEDDFDSEGSTDVLSEDDIDGNVVFEDSDVEMDGDSAEDDGLEGFDPENSESPKAEEEAPRVRENPYVAPVSRDAAPSAKYVPPSMRVGAPSDTEATTRLRRQLQGLLNKLSEANLLTILKDLEGIYEKNARQHVTSVLIDILMGLISDRSPLTDTFIILHAGFIAAVYKVIGTHFGAQLLERLVSEFDTQYEAEKSSSVGRKEASNITALLAEMYTFQVIGSTIIFDYIRLFLTELSDLNTELLLKIIKNCGPQLRHDDPSSLKDIVIMLQKAVSVVGEDSLPVRTKFMIETINNLKNNRQKTGLVASSIALEHTTRMKKTLGTLNARAGNASEPLGISLTDIKGSKKEGKWWLVGASWRNENNTTTTTTNNANHDPKESEAAAQDQSDLTHTEGGETTNLLQLAKQQRMNTDIRRAIFINIMSSSDYKDAHHRLTKLKLKKAQELEIPRVLIHCAGAEQSYNPYYTLIAKRLCSEHRFKWAFQYGLWDLFRRLGEKDDGRDDDGDRLDDEDGEDTDIGLRKLVNLGRLYGDLVAEGALSLTMLKTLNFAYLQPKTKSFLEVLLLTALKTIKARKSGENSSEAAIVGLFSKAKDAPQVIAGLQYFLAKEVSIADFATTSSERKTLKSAVRVATDTLAILVASSGVVAA